MARDSPTARCVWLTGAPAAGKTTIALGLAAALQAAGVPSTVLDGDVLRATTSHDLGFDGASRIEQARRAATLAREATERGSWALVALVSPLVEARSAARAVLGDRMVLVYVAASLATRQARDPKGLYRRAARGEITNLTGYDAPYDVPAHPDHIVPTDIESPAESVATLLAALLPSRR